MSQFNAPENRNRVSQYACIVLILPAKGLVHATPTAELFELNILQT